MSSADDRHGRKGRSLALDLDLAHPPSKVWRALTDPVLLTKWLLPVVELALEPGATFTFRAPPQPGWDGTVNCRLLIVEPNRKLSYAWIVGDLDTVVTFTLTPTPTGTRLSLVQSGFKAEQNENLAGARYGWKLMAGRLPELLDELSKHGPSGIDV